MAKYVTTLNPGEYFKYKGEYYKKAGPKGSGTVQSLKDDKVRSLATMTGVEVVDEQEALSGAGLTKTEKEETPQAFFGKESEETHGVEDLGTGLDNSLDDGENDEDEDDNLIGV